MSSPRKSLYVVHCIDTEGPFYESINATFQRIKRLGINLDQYPKNLETIKKLQNKSISLGGREEEISDWLSKDRLRYLSDWKQLREMVLRITSLDFRKRFPDSNNNPYTYNWFIMDFVGFKHNPRKRPEGFGKLWKWYSSILKDQKYEDEFYWHFHSVPVSGIGTESVSYTHLTLPTSIQV